ncbi:hypothetical protein EUS_21690 [[Eubacterium] siraeum 70/3]|uniref:Uncharacterized protein n=1 Tax=[Eubacterium] siraeum 70/3 TaxID=657319 RepID=D4JVQ8_9FIRM|nr:hypothetical protein EUS_21690 [[Eubacterium] siraeum 70/3]
MAENCVTSDDGGKICWNFAKNKAVAVFRNGFSAIC